MINKEKLYKINKVDCLLIVSIIFNVVFYFINEIKDGDWLWYVKYTVEYPSDHPLVYVLLRFFNFFFHNANYSVLIVEIFSSCLLSVFLYLIIVRLSGNKYISFCLVMLVNYFPFVNDGTPLKSILGLAFFFGFFYILITRNSSFDSRWKTGRFDYVRPILLIIFYLLILFTHVVSSYLVLALWFFYLFRGFKFSRNYLISSDIGLRVLFFSVIGMFFYFLSQFNFIYNSNSKILFLVNFNLYNLITNFYLVFYSYSIVFFLIFIISSISLIYYHNISFIDLFLLVVVLFLMFGSVPSTRWTFGRFIALLPFFSIIQLSKLFTKKNKGF